jgi:hypothetical protein
VACFGLEVLGSKKQAHMPIYEEARPFAVHPSVQTVSVRHVVTIAALCTVYDALQVIDKTYMK